MAKDYAKQGGASKRTAHTGNSGLPGWLWALVGMSLGLAIAAFAFILYRPLDEAPAGPAPARPQQAETAAAAPDIPPRTEARFKFYDLLPRYEVKPSEETYRPEPPSAAQSAARESARYLIQAGSFRDRADAERRRASMALLGIESSIKPVEVEGKGLRYRVQIGPAMNARQAEKTMRQLADNGIDSFATRSES